ncbi:MAG TPA: dioxygenase [Actinophytocola sp.]|uniref:dioxygenase family protein n=1 Tax=Actinophytocola sp. TaxID=1872138 RepID=UPI002DBA5F2D|nr:dioxygenase [Actinophytocola sp.]HEU5470572.1 dioxygenase [Actinophytocola sp.]
MTLTDQVVASFGGAASPRFAEIMTSLVRHLHAFIGEVRLTEAEWAAAIDFLTRTGQQCDDRRQEFILLSDVLGASMAVIDVNHPTGGTATESTVLGPFFVPGAPEFAAGEDISAGAPGTPCHFSGTVRSPAGDPVPDAEIDVWQSDETGHYDVQYPDLDQPRGRARLRTDASGAYSFSSVRPESYPIPHDGPVGDLLKAAGRGPMRPAHIHFKITAPGFRTLVTHIFVAGDPHLGSDAVFGVKDALITGFDGDRASFDFTLARS